MEYLRPLEITGMTQFKLENHNAVTLLNRLRIATHSTTSAKRRVVYNGLSDALKGLGLIDSKEKIEGIYEGVDKGGNHWFMVDMGDRLAEPGVRPDNLFSKEVHSLVVQLHQAIGTVTGAVPPLEIEAVIRAAIDVLLNAKDSILPSRLAASERSELSQYSTSLVLCNKWFLPPRGEPKVQCTMEAGHKGICDASKRILVLEGAWKELVELRSRANEPGLTSEAYLEICSVAQSLRLVDEGQDEYFNGLAARLTAITSRLYNNEVSHG